MVMVTDLHVYTVQSCDMLCSLEVWTCSVDCIREENRDVYISGVIAVLALEKHCVCSLGKCVCSGVLPSCGGSLEPHKNLCLYNNQFPGHSHVMHILTDNAMETFTRILQNHTLRHMVHTNQTMTKTDVYIHIQLHTPLCHNYFVYLVFVVKSLHLFISDLFT